MKKYIKCILAIIAGIVAGDVVYRKTKRRQQKAEEKSRHIPYGFYEALVKRPVDVVLAGLAIVILSPVTAAVALAVRVKLGSPVLFTQERPGLDGRIFCIYKFRTMMDKRGSDGQLLPDKDRLTRFGRMLRSTSLDELPELFNIVKGDMSIVGPRPLLAEYLDRYNDRQKRRHEVRPGLTGYAQVNGRNSLSWEERLEDDVRYVEKITFWGDMKIILKTVGIVLRRDGITSGTSETMEVFMGNGREKEKVR